MKHASKVIWLLLVMALVAAACGDDSTTTTTAASTTTAAPVTTQAATTTAAPVSSVQEIRIGLLFPYTGSFGFLGTEQANGVKLVLEAANITGGIAGVPIIIIEADSQSDPAIGATEAQRLIDQDHVDIIIGSYSSGISASASPVAERNGVIFWEVGAVADNLSQQGYKYYLRTVGNAASYGAADLDFVENFVAPQMGIAPEDVRIAIVNENGAFGTSVGDGIENQAAARGYDVVIRESYDDKSPDMTPVVLRVKDAAPDVLFIVPLPASTKLFWEAAREQDFNVLAVVGSAGFGSSSFPDTFGAAGVEGAMDVEAPSIAFMDTTGLQADVSAVFQQYLAQYQAEYGRPCLVHCGDGMGSAYVLVSDVLPRAITEFDSVDADSIRAAADATDIPVGGTLQGFGVKFAAVGEPNAGDNTRAFSVIMQWRDGNLVTVWPASLAVMEPTFPLPPWSER